MQLLLDGFAWLIIFAALGFQFVWMFIIRKARDDYVRDITHFREPSGSLSRYYGWRVESVGRAASESLVVNLLAIMAVVIYAIVVGSIDVIVQLFPLIILIGVVAIVGAILVARRVKNLIEARKAVEQRLEEAEYLVEGARNIIDDLLTSDSDSKGRVWFALFQIAQRQDKMGWSVRDTILEKEDEITEQSAGKEGELDTIDEGPGIET
ncbi:ABC transporter ATP-binding protein [Candidatus Thorarchaeota archaeon]|nr:MAG: ABC transporter ATP-binding protein [Candidatus Thorarchaeota archaeon]